MIKAIILISLITIIYWRKDFTWKKILSPFTPVRPTIGFEISVLFAIGMYLIEFVEKLI